MLFFYDWFYHEDMRKGLILLLFDAIRFASGPSEGVSSQSEESVSSQSMEDAVLCDLVEWAKDIKPEEVESITHTYGNTTVFFAPICTEYSTNAEDIASFFSFLQTHLTPVSKEEAQVPGLSADYYTLKTVTARENQYSLSLHQGYLAVRSKEYTQSFYKIKGGALRLSHAERTYNFANTGLHSVVYSFDNDEEIGLFYHMEAVSFVEAPSDMAWVEPLYYLESPHGPIEILSEKAFFMNLDGAKKLYYVTSGHDFTPIFDMEKGLFAFDVLNDASEEYSTQYNDIEFMVFTETAQIPSFFRSETTAEQFKKRFDQSFFEDNALILWNIVTPYYHQMVYPRRCEIGEDGIALYADITEARGGWAACGKYLLFYVISKASLPVEQENIHGILSQIPE